MSTLNDRIASLSPAKQALVKSRLQYRKKSAPLSYSQQRLWFLQQLAPSSAAYNLLYSVRLEGRLDRTAVQWAIEQLIERHEALRTVVPVEQGEPRQEGGSTKA